MSTDATDQAGNSVRASSENDDDLIAFPGRSPVLDAGQLDVLREYGSERDVAEGDVLFADGDQAFDLIILLSGTADVIDGHGRPEVRVVASFGPAEFLGEIGMLTGQRAFLSAEEIAARSVIVATGARYNRLPLDRLAEFEGAGVYYAATQTEAQACAAGPVAIVGGGNSAGQAALFLSRSCAEVNVIIRRDSLEATMSRYLIDRIERHPGIVIWTSSQVTALTGTNCLQAVRLTREGIADEVRLPVTGLFVFIGAKPGTGWLGGQLAEDKDGFLLTGSDIPASSREDESLTPLFLETSRPGIFAVGDVRSGSVKRVAAATGEGSVAVRLAFERLEQQDAADPARASL